MPNVSPKLFFSTLLFTLLFSFFLDSVAHSAINAASCAEVFASAPETPPKARESSEDKFFRNEPPSKSFLISELKKNQLGAKQARALQETLLRVIQNPRRGVWVSGFQVLAAMPKNTEQAQYLGLNLVHSILNSVGLKQASGSSIFVSTKALPLVEIASRVFDKLDIGERSVRTRETIESQIEMAAAAIGSPSDRMVISTEYHENSGSFADMVGGLIIKSITIINRNTGVTIQLNFFDRVQGVGIEL